MPSRRRPRAMASAITASSSTTSTLIGPPRCILGPLRRNAGITTPVYGVDRPDSVQPTLAVGGARPPGQEALRGTTGPCGGGRRRAAALGRRGRGARAAGGRMWRLGRGRHRRRGHRRRRQGRRHGRRRGRQGPPAGRARLRPLHARARRRHARPGVRGRRLHPRRPRSGRGWRAGEATAGEPTGPPAGFEEADKACRHFLDDLVQDGGGPIDAEAQDRMLKFAECMREHGVDMPDPEFSGGGGGSRPGSAVPASIRPRRRSRTPRRRAGRCSGLMAAPDGGPGGGPASRSASAGASSAVGGAS